MSQNPIHFMRLLRAPSAKFDLGGQSLSARCQRSPRWPRFGRDWPFASVPAWKRDGWLAQQFLRQPSPRRCLCASSLPACKLRLQSTQARSCAEALVERVLLVCICAQMGK